jgi:hypothetical protein
MDDLERLIEEDDREFRVEEFGVLPPREYAAANDMSPQLVYYYIRNGLPKKYCECGRLVVKVKEADEWLRTRKAKATDLPADSGD